MYVSHICILATVWHLLNRKKPPFAYLYKILYPQYISYMQPLNLLSSCQLKKNDELYLRLWRDQIFLWFFRVSVGFKRSCFVSCWRKPAPNVANMAETSCQYHWIKIGSQWYWIPISPERGRHIHYLLGILYQTKTIILTFKQLQFIYNLVNTLCRNVFK